jgi:hypothetical protein
MKRAGGMGPIGKSPRWGLGRRWQGRGSGSAAAARMAKRVSALNVRATPRAAQARRAVILDRLSRQSWHGLEQASVAERKESLLPEHDVIQHPNPEHVARFFQAPRDLLVLLARSGITARVIMHENHRRCA